MSRLRIVFKLYSTTCLFIICTQRGLVHPVNFWKWINFPSIINYHNQLLFLIHSHSELNHLIYEMIDRYVKTEVARNLKEMLSHTWYVRFIDSWVVLYCNVSHVYHTCLNFAPIYLYCVWKWWETRYCTK